MAKRSQYSRRISRKGPSCKALSSNSWLGRLNLERLEDRLAMDGAGWVHTNPPEDPDTVVGVAEISAGNDYITASAESSEIRIDVLANDSGPDGAGSLSIKLASPSAQGAAISISDDGSRIIYSPAAGELTSDSFYYIVEDDAGRLGKANVQIQALPRYYSQPATSNDWFNVFEDSAATTLEVLSNDGVFASGEIIAVTETPHNSLVAIADDGRSLRYQPAFGASGNDSFEYTVRKADGETAAFFVGVRIRKPVEISSYQSTALNVDAGLQKIEVLTAMAIVGPTPEPPRIVSVSQPLVGTLVISEDGRKLIFEAPAGFIGSINYQFTLRYGPADHQSVAGNGQITVENTFLAVNDWFNAEPDSQEQSLDVLANDPILRRYNLPDVTLRIVALGESDQGGQIRLSADGRTVYYMPAAGFLGAETFSYEVEDSSGHRDAAVVTVEVGERSDEASPTGYFTLPGELEQFLIDRAVLRYAQMFGHMQWWQENQLQTWTGRMGPFVADGSNVVQATTSFSQTNVQESGIDEADIVETDGRFVFGLTHGKLVIVDLGDPGQPVLASLTALDGHFQEMYLQGDRLTLIGQGYRDGNSRAVVTVLNVTDRNHPVVQERTEIDGEIIDSRAVGNRVHLAVVGLNLPVPEQHKTHVGGGEDVWTIARTETLDEYVARVRPTLITTALPRYQTFNAAGELVDEGLLTSTNDIHKPFDQVDDSLLAVATIDVADGEPGIDASAGIFAGRAAHIYMNDGAFYALRADGNATGIVKFSIDETGKPTLASVGKVDGVLVNQFSVDEYEGRLRIATTELEFENTASGWRRVRERTSNVFVLEDIDGRLVVVGSIENLAPTESIRSVRFLEDRAYVVTFRVIDPLFTIDLGDPTDPTVEGALKIPGYSDYLHPVGEDYVIGIGRDADEITGQVGLPQISLFYVGDFGNPRLIDQVTMDGVGWASSEALFDHHAVSYFASANLLTIPVSWSEYVQVDDDGDGFHDRIEYKNHSSMWAFEVIVDQFGGGSIEVEGEISHEAEARRSVRLGNALVTISEYEIKVHDIANIGNQIGSLFFGPLPVADQFTVAEDSGPTQLDVRDNDRAGVGGDAPLIVSVTQPVLGRSLFGWDNYGDPAGTVTISDDGTRLIFTPAKDIFGTVTFTYTVFDPVHGEETALVTVNVSPVADDPIAIDDEFEIGTGSSAVRLDVLANDADPDMPRYGPTFWPQPLISDVAIPQQVFGAIKVEFTDFMVFPGAPFSYLTQLKVVEVSAGSADGMIEISPDGLAVIYTSADGFTGVETFTYTIETADGRTDFATVRVKVGLPVDDSPSAAIQTNAPVRPRYRPEPRAIAEHRTSVASAQSDAPSLADELGLVVAVSTQAAASTAPAVGNVTPPPSDVVTTSAQKRLPAKQLRNAFAPQGRDGFHPDGPQQFPRSEHSAFRDRAIELLQDAVLDHESALVLALAEQLSNTTFDAAFE